MKNKYEPCKIGASFDEGCIGAVKVHEEYRIRRGAQECKPGTTWKEDCNSCFCTSTGIAGCTRKACVHTTTTTV